MPATNTPLTALSFTPAPEALTSASDWIAEPLEPAANRKPFAPLKSTSTTGAAEKPGAVVPSISTSPVIFGRALTNWIDPATLKLIVSAPASALASITACRNEPAPLSFKFATANVASISRTSSGSYESTACLTGADCFFALRRNNEKTMGRVSVWGGTNSRSFAQRVR